MAWLGPCSEARNATVLGLNDVDKQKLEEARQLAMSMTSHPVAFGTIEHTERAGELLGLLWQEVLRLQCDMKDVRAELQHARDGLTKGRTRMREDNQRLKAARQWIDGATAATPGLTDAELGRAMAAIGKKARDALGA